MTPLLIKLHSTPQRNPVSVTRRPRRNASPLGLKAYKVEAHVSLWLPRLALFFVASVEAEPSSRSRNDWLLSVGTIQEQSEKDAAESRALVTALNKGEGHD